MLKNNCFPAKNLDERIASHCVERRTMCGCWLNFGSAMIGKWTQMS